MDVKKKEDGGKFTKFEKVPEKPQFPQVEESVLEFWKDIDAFKESLRQSKDRPIYTFYDGPPFATGLPHYGHLLAGTIKDIVTRYAHQTGHHVERRFGWDCHGLPVEFEIDKKLGITSSQDVEKMGIKAYNAECRSIVSRYTKEWEATVTRIGRWIDFENDYKTMNPSFMESVWWVLKTIYDKNLVYRGLRVMPFSTGLMTPLSNFEAGQNYKDVSDPAVYVSFPLVDDSSTAFVAWTTTPWTLPSNIGLCVNPEFEYVKIEEVSSGAKYILLESRLSELYPKLKKKGSKAEEFYKVLERMKGTELEDVKYVPLFDYFVDGYKERGYRVILGDYVTDDSGTGVVHQAPAFGEVDYNNCLEKGLIAKGTSIPMPVNEKGLFTSDVPDFEGMYVKEADNAIIEKVKTLGRLVKKEQIVHSYPFCWRSDTPLLYKAVPCWFVKVSDFKDKLVANNLKTYWVPSFVKEKRFHNWLENAIDWNISRNRYWGTPIPIWTSEDGEEIVVVGSVAELEELSGVKVTDLHRENIDHITIPSKQGKGDLRRTSEVFDCWFESGSMPYAQQHYPFENKEFIEKGFPADFVAEGLDQTRGWFYTLMVLSTALFDKPAFKNLVANGLILAEDGKKMSKRLKNYPDPQKVIDAYGADALRLYLINSPVVRAEPLRFQEAGVLGVVKDVFLPWYNAFRFFAQNSNRLLSSSGSTFDIDSAVKLARSSDNLMDRWILASLHGLIEYTHQEMKAYRLYTVVPRLLSFIEDLTNWYVRLNRARLKNSMNDKEDCEKALATLYVVLVDLSKVMAPLTPFFTEYMYQMLVCRENSSKISKVSQDGKYLVKSVHFEMLPEAETSIINKRAETQMKHMQDVINLCRLARGNDIPLKKPVKELILVHSDAEVLELLKEVEHYVIAEANVKNIVYTTEETKWCTLTAQADGRVLGKKLGKKFKSVLAAVKKLSHEQLLVLQNTGSLEIEGETLTANDLKLDRKVIAASEKYASKVSDANLCVIIDKTDSPEIQQEFIARDFVSKVQKLRKSAGVEVSDKLQVFFEVSSDASPVASALEDQVVFLRSKLGEPPMRSLSIESSMTIVGSETEEIEGEKVQIILAKASSLWRSDLPENVKLVCSSLSESWLAKNGKDSFQAVVDGEAVTLVNGKDYFL